MVIRHSVKELLAKNSVTPPMKYVVDLYVTLQLTFQQSKVHVLGMLHDIVNGRYFRGPNWISH